MEDSCGETGLELGRDSLPSQQDNESMHRGAGSQSKSTFYKRGYTLRCASQMWASNFGRHAVKEKQ